MCSRHPQEASESSSDAVTSSVELDLSLDKVTVGEDIPIITFTKAASMEESIEEPTDERTETPATPKGDAAREEGDATPLNTSKEDEETMPSNANTNGEASSTILNGDPSESKEKPTEGEEKPTESKEKSPENEEIENKEMSCPSCEALESDEAVFLHVHVTPLPGMTYTYTPINNAIGIDIPKGQRSARNTRSPSVQQVKTCFCFAFVLKRYVCKCVCIIFELIHFYVHAYIELHDCAYFSC